MSPERNWPTQAEKDAAVQAITGHVIEITEKHFAQADRDFQMDKSPTASWFIFGLRLSSALISHTKVLKDPAYLAFLRGLFAELFDYLMLAYEGNPALEMEELHRAFGERMDHSPILPLLLPERAQSVIEEIDQIRQSNYEEDMRRQDQMGY